MHNFVCTLILNTSIAGMAAHSTTAVLIFCVFATFSAQGNNSVLPIGHNGKKTEDNHLGCCGNITYNILESSCCNNQITPGLSQLMAQCCKSRAYNPLNEICCEDCIHTRISAHGEDCGSVVNNKPTSDEKNNTPDTIEDPDLNCGSTTHNHSNVMYCSGKKYEANPLFQCCGEQSFKLTDNVLCCNGILHVNVSENSECVDGFIYTDSKIKMTCGSKIYDHHKKKCCSGHLYDITSNPGKAECCGSLLLKNENQTCCSSTVYSLSYETKSSHSCCGHYYYNVSLWSCCAGHLKPTPKKHNSTAEYRLKPLTDLIPEKCNKVVFGKVESVALDKHQRIVKFKIVDSPSNSTSVFLDHCSTPALENGMTYLWEKTDTNHQPLSLPIVQASDVHMFHTLCNNVGMKDNNNV